MWVISDPRHFTRGMRPLPFRSSRYFWPPSPPSFFLGTNTSPTLLGSQALFPLTHLVPLLFWALLSSFAVTFKKRCLYLFIGICGTWMHRFVFWKLYLKPALITSFRLALRSVWMDVRKHRSLSGLITFSMLAESLWSFDLSRKIEGDSVLRVIDQVLGSYLLSCMAFSVSIRSRSRDLSVAKLHGLFTFLLVRKQSKYGTDKLREQLP